MGPNKPNENYSFDLKWQDRRQESARLKAKKNAPPPPDRRGRKRKGDDSDEPSSVAAPGTNMGVVVETYRHHVMALNGVEVTPCLLAGADIPADMLPLVVGDRVTFDIDEGTGRIRHALPRTSILARLREDRSRRSADGGEGQVLAANVDVAVIVASAAAPPFHPRFVDRYLVMCQYGGVAPVICLNKCDLVKEPPSLANYERMGVPVVFTSAAENVGIDQLRALLRGKLAVLTGQSGVGKSSLINRLLGQDELRVGTVSDYSSRGRHTTTMATLRPLPDGGFLIDTPGIRSLGLWNIERRDLRLYFPEFEDFADQCKFRDCAHMGEPSCAVRAASERGDLPPERYDSYLRLMQA